MPIAVFPTTNPHSFLQLQLPQLPLDACSHSSCPTHVTIKTPSSPFLIYQFSFQCSYTVHGGVRLFARSCCSERERLSISNGLSHSFSPQLDLCREDWILPQRIFFIVSIVCIIFCLIMIGVVVRERRRQQYDRGWALMEPFFAGAIILYSIVSLIIHIQYSITPLCFLNTAITGMAQICALELLDFHFCSSTWVYPLLWFCYS
jgi:hypothetical protein